MRRARSVQHITAARLRTGRLAASLCALLALALFTGVSPAQADPLPPAVAAPIDLGSAAGFSVLAGPSITNTGAGTVLALDLGVTGTLAGFPPGIVTGTKHVADQAATLAQADRQTAYEDVSTRTGGTAFGGDLAGQRFTPGFYSTAAAVTNTGTITLDADGDPSALFVFQVGAALSSAASTKVVLTGGALAHNVYWQVVGAVSLGANVAWFGTLLGGGVVALGDGASLKGRILTPSTVALANSPVTKPIDDLVAPVVSIAGGSARSTNDTTPAISGTTDEPGTPQVTVTIGSQVLTTRAANGAWALSANALSIGTHDVVVALTDPSGNTGVASQDLTVDTAAPEVTINGGATVDTHDTTPTIAGTTDEPGTPTVTVTVGSQTLTTNAADGAWTVDAATLSESSHGVEASVTDAAGNTRTRHQVLTVDVTVPVLAIDGGATRTSSDTSPWTYGTTAEKAGTVVHLTIGGQSLTATAQPGGTWGVSAQTLPQGAYTVLATVTDAAGNTGTATQQLQVGSVPSTSSYRPDAEVRQAGHSFIGRNSYDVAAQRVAVSLRGSTAQTATFEVRTTNRGDAAEQVTVKGTVRSSQFVVAYLYGGANVTTAVVAGTFRTTTLQPGQSTSLTVRATKLAGVPTGSSRTFTVQLGSTHDLSKVDAVATAVRVAQG